jgi:hypothetical protein
MSGALAMGTNKVTGLGAPTAGTDATTKTYVDAGDALQVLKAGDTMSGVLAMGANKITGVADPSLAQDVVTKNYSDTLFGSTAAAATSASNAATSETNAANSASGASTSASTATTKAGEASTSATNAANSAIAAAASAVSSLPLVGGALTGAVTTTSTFDGRDVSVDGTKLDTIATSANNYTHPANHAISVVTGLQAALDSKSATTHNHDTLYDPIGASVAMAIALGG